MRAQKRYMSFIQARQERLPEGYGASAKFGRDMKNYLIGRYDGASQKTCDSLRC